MNLKKRKSAISQSFGEVTAMAGQDYKVVLDYWRAHDTLRMIVCFAIMFVAFWFGGWNRLDSDFGWHLQSGYYIRSHGIPAHDIYTYTARSWRWIDHEWGNDVILSYVYGWGGYALADAMYAAAWAGALLVAAGRKARLLTMLVAGLAITPYGFLRPLAWTALLFAVTVTVVQAKKTKWYWYLPPMFILWANLHAGFVAGLAAIAYFAVRRRSKRLVLILLLCFAATFINAYGPRLYEEIGRTIFDSQIHFQINEWAYFKIPTAAKLYTVLWSAGFFLFAARKWKNWLGLGPLLFAATMSATRNMPLFVVGTLREVDGRIATVVKDIPKKLDLPRKLVLGTLLLILFTIFVYGFKQTYLPYGTNREAGYPVEAIAYLKASPCKGNLFNSYDFGGYLIWKLPSQPVYIDGRMPTWQPYMDRYESILEDPAKNYKPEFQRYNITCALLEKNSNADKLIKQLKDDHWRVTEDSGVDVLLLSPIGTKS